MGSVLDAFVRFLADTKDIDKAIGPNGQIAKTADAGGKSAGTKIGERIGTGVRTAFLGAGASGGYLFAGAVESATKFEDQLRTINTVAGLSDAELGKVGDSIQALSRESGKSTDDLTAGFYDLVSAGIPADKAIGVLRDSAKLATGALGSTAESVDLVTSALNAYGLDASQSTRVTDIFAKAVADGKVTAAELGASISQIAPVASAAGISIEEVSAGFALMTAKGTPASQAATQMKAAISALLTPNETLNRIQAKTGINFANLAKEKGLSVALEKLRQVTADTGGEFDNFSTAVLETMADIAKNGDKATSDLGDTIGEFRNNLGLTEAQAKRFEAAVGREGAGQALADLAKELGQGNQGFVGAIGSVEGYQFALNSTGDSAGDFAKQIQETMGAAGLAEEQYQEKSKSAAEQGKRLAATIGTFLQDVGGPFVSTLGPGVAALGQLSIGMSGLITPAKAVGGALGGIAAKAVLGLGKLATFIIPTLGSLIPAVAGAATGVGTAIGGFISAAIPIAMALLPFLLIAAVVAAIVFLINNPDIVAKIADFVGGVLQNIANFMGQLPGILLGIVGAAVGAIGQALGRLPGIVVGIVGNIAGLFVGLGGRIISVVGSFLLKVGEFFITLPQRIGGFVVGILAHFIRLAPAVIGQVAGLVGKIVQWFFSIPGKLVALGGQIVSNIIRGLASLPGKLADAIRSAFAGLRIDIGPFHISGSGVQIDLPHIDLPHFDVGTQYVPADMLAVVHRGEMIIPRDEADSIRNGRMNLGEAARGTPHLAPQGGGGVNVTVPIAGLVAARTPEDIARPLRQLARTGAFTRTPKLVPNRG